MKDNEIMVVNYDGVIYQFSKIDSEKIHQWYLNYGSDIIAVNDPNNIPNSIIRGMGLDPKKKIGIGIDEVGKYPDISSTW